MPLHTPAPFSTARLPRIPLRSTFPTKRPLQSPHLRSPLLSKATIRPASQGRLYNPRRPQYNRFSNAQRIYNLWSTSPNFRYGVGAAGIGAGVFYCTNLERVPISGRLRFNCISPALEQQIAGGQEQQIMQEFQRNILPAYHPDARMVDRVMMRLIPASGLEDLNWEVKVIDDPEQKNAFVLPG